MAADAPRTRVALDQLAQQLGVTRQTPDRKATSWAAYARSDPA